MQEIPRIEQYYKETHVGVERRIAEKNPRKQSRCFVPMFNRTMQEHVCADMLGVSSITFRAYIKKFGRREAYEQCQLRSLAEPKERKDKGRPKPKKRRDGTSSISKKDREKLHEITARTGLSSGTLRTRWLKGWRGDLLERLVTKKGRPSHYELHFHTKEGVKVFSLLREAAEYFGVSGTNISLAKAKGVFRGMKLETVMLEKVD